MRTSTMTAQEAIKRSISHNEIVYVEYSKERYECLQALCEDSVHVGLVGDEDITEFWGQLDGEEWRVHTYK